MKVIYVIKFNRDYYIYNLYKLWILQYQYLTDFCDEPTYCENIISVI